MYADNNIVRRVFFRRSQDCLWLFLNETNVQLHQFSNNKYVFKDMHSSQFVLNVITCVIRPKSDGFS